MHKMYNSHKQAWNKQKQRDSKALLFFSYFFFFFFFNHDLLF